MEEIEIDLLCEGVYRYYGFDFRQYARASLKRRIRNLVNLESLPSISALQERILYDRLMMERFLLNLSINVTAMFRDPKMYQVFRKKVIPLLHTYPSVRVWHAGCSSGEEPLSMSILLEEEGLTKRSKIYATDFNESIIKKAKAGIFPLSVMQEYTDNYQKAGGLKSFSEYYSAQQDSVILATHLRESIVYSRHNLTIDGSFNEFNVIMCRNVMIYFNEALRDRVLLLLHNSLCRFGILILGNKETLQFTPLEHKYKELDGPNRIYQRID
ncbi:chemotaxis protein CheR [Colwellia sp. PAMC 20917]|nr:chemotaxis protein CheR [Colwellia sp. PAMC 20917]